MQGVVKTYSWGKAGQHSRVWKMSDEPHEGRPGAELWLGQHSAGMARIHLPDQQPQQLKQLIDSCGDLVLGPRVYARYGSLPFLLKILSIARPLSVQAHPDRALAEELHRRSPQQYPDGNHKPEMAVALSPVQLLGGFRSPAEILALSESFPPLQRLLALAGHTLSPQSSEYDVRTAYTSLLTVAREALQPETCALLAYPTPSPPQAKAVADSLAAASDALSKGDPGTLSFFFLNLLTLQPGEAVYIGQNEPHAYLSGDLIEVMALSDNVVRGGLTEKFVDAEVLADMLTSSERQRGGITTVQPTVTSVASARVSHFISPADEFALCTLEGRGTIAGRDGGLVVDNLIDNSATSPRVLLCLEGSGALVFDDQEEFLSPGSAYLIPAGCTPCTLTFADSFFAACAYVPAGS